MTNHPAQSRNLQDFEESVIAALIRGDQLNKPPTCGTIFQILHDWGRKTSLGAIYGTLQRLESKNLTKTTGKKVLPGGGRAHTTFRVTPEGLEAMRKVQDSRSRMFEGDWLRECLS